MVDLHNTPAIMHSSLHPRFLPTLLLPRHRLPLTRNRIPPHKQGRQAESASHQSRWFLRSPRRLHGLVQRSRRYRRPRKQLLPHSSSTLPLVGQGPRRPHREEREVHRLSVSTTSVSHIYFTAYQPSLSNIVTLSSPPDDVRPSWIQPLAQ